MVGSRSSAVGAALLPALASHFLHGRILLLLSINREMDELRLADRWLQFAAEHVDRHEVARVVHPKRGCA